MKGEVFMINTDTLEKLISIYKDNTEMLKIISEQLESFEKYHSAIYFMESKLKVFTTEAVGTDEYQDAVKEMDKKRTRCHNDVIMAVSMFNRMAEKEGIAPFYDGEVSEERPYRRQIANAVLSYVEEIIEKRR